MIMQVIVVYSYVSASEWYIAESNWYIAAIAWYIFASDVYIVAIDCTSLKATGKSLQVAFTKIFLAPNLEGDFFLE